MTTFAVTSVSSNLCHASTCSRLPNNQLSGFGYDASGNMTSNSGVTYNYNAESELTSTAGVTYTYDGDGHRVKKSSGTEYWGAGPLLESDGSGTLQREFVFAEGKRIARRDSATGTLYYYFTDLVGFSDVVTTSNGTIQNESDYYPYGGERVYSQVLTNQNYKFTGKERDQESGLDNFGARYDSSTLGRFMTPDWDTKPVTVPYAKFGDPQTLNLYSYVENAPVNRADADGHEDSQHAGTKEPNANTACKGDANRTCLDNADGSAAGTAQNTVPVSRETYKTSDKAATAALDAINKESNREGVEYGGRVVKMGDGKYKYTPAVTQGHADSVDVDNGGKEGSRIPAGSTNAGIYHTHPEVPGHDAYRFSYHYVYHAKQERVPTMSRGLTAAS